MNELALFAGAGGGILGGILNGWRTVCAVEINDYCRRVLMQRQDDGILEPFPIWGDIKTFDGRPWAGCVDIVTGGFPCQDISSAGKGAGIGGERSGLWGEMARIIGEVRPCYVLVENSPMLTLRGLGRVLGDLSAMGFNAEWGVISAAHTGAPHKRERIWVVANNPQHGRGQGRPRGFDSSREGQRKQPLQDVADANSSDSDGWRGTLQVGRVRGQSKIEDDGNRQGIKWPIEPGMGRMAYGVANRVDRLTAIGNGQVPRVVRSAWELLKVQTDG